MRLRSLMTVAIAMLATTTVWAQQGTTHNGPTLDDATIQDYLVNYIGYDSSKKYPYAYAPKAVGVGEVIFIQINDYWKGSDNLGTNSPSVYNQLKYGVKSIDKVTHHALIGNGDLYHFDATTNRFFFAVRTSNHYSYEQYAWPISFRWYNELSTCEDNNSKFDDLKPAFDRLKGGQFMPVPHSCDNSLERNHFTTLYEKESIGQTHTVSAMLFVPTSAKITSNKKASGGKFDAKSTPQVFFYVNQLDGERVEKATANCNYAVNLTWNTSFDKANASNITFIPWSSTNGGVKEETYVYRKIEGPDFSDKDFKLVDNKDNNSKLIATNSENTTEKNWADEKLPNPGTHGYDVTYYIVTKAVKYDKTGKRLTTDEEMGTAISNQVTFHIPGSEDYFELLITNDFNSKYNTVANQIHKSYNLITSNLSAKKSELIGNLPIEVGTKFELKREVIEGKDDTKDEVLNTLVVTAVNGNTYTYTLNGVEGTATSIEQLVIAAATYSDQVESVPGKQYDANYQLTYTNGEKIVESNIVSSKGLRTDVEVEKLYRSGTPDPENNASQELYTCNVRFKPVMQSNVANYVLWQNAEKSLIRVDQTDGKTFTLVTKDEQGNFNVPAGTVSPDNEGYITLRINTSLDKKARLYEMNKYQNKFTDGDLFFTIEVCATGGNSYGNYEQGSGFAGLDAEHVVLVNAELFKGVNKATGKYRAEISWSKNNNPAIDAEDYVYNEPDYYTVHRWLRTDGYKQYGDDNVPCGYSPIKTFYKGSDETGYEVAQTTEDAEGLKFVPDNMNNGSFSIIDFVNDSKNPTSDFPAMYYVKAHYKSPFNGKATFVNANGDLQNYMEKNSYVTSVTIGQITGVDEIETSQVVSVKYYNMMGIEVAQPEAGEIVVARTQYANGVVTSKVIKK